ncbi:MAG: chromate efflux transporter [Alphaproteobacteria bacterium]
MSDKGSPDSAQAVRTVPYLEALRVWVRVGFTSFGGPAGQIALMHRIVVDEKRWVDEARFLHALNYCMLLPGPEAQQLATYVGWLLHRTWGGLTAGILFVLPGFFVILSLSILYAAFRDVTLVAGLMFGVKAAVLAIVFEAMERIAARALKTKPAVAIAAAAFVAMFFFQVPFPAVILAAAAIGFAAGVFRPGLLVKGERASGPGQSIAPAPVVYPGEQIRPTLGRAVRIVLLFAALWVAPVAASFAVFGGSSVFVDIGVFFSKMAVVTFGGAYAVLAYVAQEAVSHYGWLKPGEMVDALGLAETTPGPLILVLQFVGFLAAFRSPGALDPWLAGVIGAVLTVWVTFVPCFLWIFLGAPYVEALRGKPALGAALSAITAAVVGVILNLALWFGLHVLFADVTQQTIGPLRLLVPDWASLNVAALALSALSFVALFRFRVGMIPVLAGSAALGALFVLLGA